MINFVEIYMIIFPVNFLKKTISSKRYFNPILRLN